MEWNTVMPWFDSRILTEDRDKRIKQLTQENERLMAWLRYIRYGVGMYEQDSDTKKYVLKAIDAALGGVDSPESNIG